MRLEDKPGTWGGMKLRNIHTHCVCVVDYAVMSHVQLIEVVSGNRFFWDYRKVRKHFVEKDNNADMNANHSTRS